MLLLALYINLFLMHLLTIIFENINIFRTVYTSKERVGGNMYYVNTTNCSQLIIYSQLQTRNVNTTEIKGLLQVTCIKAKINIYLLQKCGIQQIGDEQRFDWNEGTQSFLQW